ncbi:glutamate ABC transporter permease [Pilimelia terevasa]|uniref:Glutamate ABC transporter permease n=1 Tax=Pilimelia terevasa TaxID=53372 RepID=A0A8J3BK64_9ACTN|nr:amino acid ABC transporter permease [Pilimelia terevasa]GGK27490.1 glutamate ABC transporter permease [Pilimelia terevasa]
MSATSTMLYDHPGPRARIRNRLLTVGFSLLTAALLWYVYVQFDEKGQWAPALWKPFLKSATWIDFILPGLWGTISAAAVAMVLALAFGVIFSVGRLSAHAAVSVPAGVVVEFCRAVPLLLMIFFLSYGVPFITGAPFPAFWAVVIGLTLYNGSVLAEAFRAGIRAVPAGQSEAGYALGLRKSQVMTHILVPQAARSMLPVIVSQLVVLLKDTALGYIIAYPELLQQGVNVLSANYGNVMQAAIVVAAIYIAINSVLTWFAGWLDRRTTRTGRTTVRIAPVQDLGTAAA